jgi:hypothetical protein
MQRPISVTVFAVLNLVFATIGIIAVIASAFTLFVMADAKNPVVKIMQDSPVMQTWMMVSVPLGLAACVALLASGIGLLGLKPWARTLAIGYAIYGILSCILGTIMNYVFLFGPLMEQAQHTRGPEAAAAIGGAIGGLIGGCLGLIYPVLLLIFMLLPKVAAAFRPQEYVEAELMGTSPDVSHPDPNNPYRSPRNP